MITHDKDKIIICGGDGIVYHTAEEVLEYQLKHGLAEKKTKYESKDYLPYKSKINKK